jgi:protein TonB
MKGTFRSIYQPSYQLHHWSWAGLRQRYQKAFLLAILVHALVLVILLYKPFDISFKKEEEVLIEVSSSVVIPDGQSEAEVKKEPPPKPASTDETSAQPTAEFKTKTKPSPKKIAPAPVEKVEKKEEPLKPPTPELPKEQPESPKKTAEPVKEEPAKVEPIIKEVVVKEDKKEITLQKQDKPQEKPQDKPVEPVKVLPVLVDKKNKEKDAPELPPASSAASSSSSAPSSSSEQAQASSAATSSGSGSRSEAAPAVSSAIMTSIQAAPVGPAAASPAATSSAAAATQGIPGGANTEAQYNNRELNNKMPPYPVMAKRMRQEGTVVLVVEVLENGAAGDIRIAVTSGSELLDKVALETVKKWNFQPAKKEGVPYVQRLRIPITFKL